MEPIAIVMKYYRMGDLDQFLSGRGVAANEYDYSKGQVVTLLKQICQAITHMHLAGSGHCDIKPGNVLLDVMDHQLSIVMSDFGISRVLDPAKLKVYFEVSNIKGVSVGFAAPEVWAMFRQKSQKISDPQVIKGSDTYALAETFLAMMTRRKPWNV